MWIRVVHIDTTLSYRDLEDFFTVDIYFFDNFFWKIAYVALKKYLIHLLFLKGQQGKVFRP